MPLRHRIAALVFALAFGLGVASLAYHWATNPLPREQRAREEAMVLQARSAIIARMGNAPELQLSDPLRPNRVAGKSFIYPVDEGWEVSGHYRAGAAGPWRPWLVTLGRDGRLVAISIDGASDSTPEDGIDSRRR